MNRGKIIAEANSLEEARDEVLSKLDKGFTVASEKVLANGQSKEITESSYSIEKALKAAKEKIPAGAILESEDVLVEPGEKKIEVESYDEMSAKETILRKGKHINIKSVTLITAGRKGILGIGKKPNVYSVSYFQNALLKIRFREKVKIECEICSLDELGTIHYRDTNLYFELDLPKYWTKGVSISPFGSMFKSQYGDLTIRAGEVEDHLIDRHTRKTGYFRYLTEMGFKDIEEIGTEGLFAGEANVIFFKYILPNKNPGIGVSIVHHIIQYNIQLDGMPKYISSGTLDTLKNSFKFAPKERVDYLKQLYG